MQEITNAEARALKVQSIKEIVFCATNAGSCRSHTRAGIRQQYRRKLQVR